MVMATIGDTETEHTPGYISKLEQEIKKYGEIRDNLLKSYQRKEKSIQSAEKQDNVWKDRYTHQYTHNESLEEKLDKLRMELEELKMLESELENDGKQSADEANLSLQRQLLRLEKEGEELEWELTDHGWKLDHMAQLIYRAEEERADLLTQLSLDEFQEDNGTSVTERKIRTT